MRIQPEYLTRLRQEYPEAFLVVHPECRPEVIGQADEVLSIGGICRYAKRKDITEMIVGTEMGIIHRFKKENPGKKFIPASYAGHLP